MIAKKCYAGVSTKEKKWKNIQAERELGVKKSKNSTQMKKSKKCVVFHVREEIATNSTQKKKSKKCVDFHARHDSEEMLCCSIHEREEIEEFQAEREVGGQEIEEFLANEAIEEMRGFPRKRRNHEEFHASEEF